ncbi:MAG: hypothetical protein OHK0056_25370 [Bacteriovoracaceae bacterium]
MAHFIAPYLCGNLWQYNLLNMNEKRWFIFNKDHHLGPFSEEEIRTKFHRGELTLDGQLWTEGQTSWMAFRDITTFHKDAFPGEKTLPQWKRSLEEANNLLNAIEPERGRQVPPAPKPASEVAVDEFIEEEIEQIEEEQNIISLDREIIEDDELPPPLPPLPIEEEELPEVAQDEVVDLPIGEHGDQIEPPEVFLDDDATGEFQIEQEGPLEESAGEVTPHPLRWWSGITLVSILLLALVWFIWPKRISAPFPELTDAEKSVLTHFAKNAPDKNWMFKIHMEREKGRIYLASNRSDEAKLTVRFTSNKSRTLSLEESEFVSQIDLNNYFGASKEITMIRGTEISQGEYQVEINGKAVGWKPRLMEKLKIWPVFKDMKFVVNYTPEIIYKSQLLIYNGSPKQFEEAILAFNQAIENKRLMPLKDQLQRVIAMRSFLDGIKELFLDYIGRITKGPSIAGFERKYNLEIGPALSEMIMDNNRLSIETMNVDKEQSRQYENLMKQGKNVAGIAADIVSRVRKINKIRNTDREILTKFFEREIQKVDEQLNQTMNQIDNAIKSYTR